MQFIMAKKLKCKFIYKRTVPVKPRQKEPAHDKIKHLSIRERVKHRYIHGSISLTKHSKNKDVKGKSHCSFIRSARVIISLAVIPC